jgi:hypothetical protein
VGSNPAGRTTHDQEAMLLRTILLILAGLWIIPRILRLLRGGHSGPELKRPGNPAADPDHGKRLRDLTQQDISDAEFEEIPPEE